MECFDIKSVLCVTTRCNLRCEYCFDQNITESKEMDIKVLKMIVSYFGDFFHNSKTPLLITGGEPLYNLYIQKILSFLNKNNYLYSIFTNAILLEGALIDLLSEKQCTGIRYSCHYLNQANSLEEFDLGLEFLWQRVLLLRSKNLKISLNLLLTPFIVQRLNKIVDIVNNFSLGLKLQPIINREGNSSFKGIDLLKVISNYSKLWFKNAIGSTLPYSDYDRMLSFLLRYVEHEKSDISINCCPNIPVIFVNPDGTYSPCVYRRDLRNNIRQDQPFDFQQYIYNYRINLANNCFKSKCLVV